MKNFKRAILAALLAFILIAQTMSVLARAPNQYPQGYWDLQAAWRARDTQNGNETIRLGEAHITMFLGNADPAQAAVEWRRTSDVSLSVLKGVIPYLLDEYLLRKDRENILRILDIGWHIEEQWHIMRNDSGWPFVRAAYESRKIFYDVPVDVYAEIPGGGGDTVNYNARNEHAYGVKFGEIIANPTRTEVRDTPMYDQSSATILFASFERETFESYDWRIQREIERGNGRPILFAWNLSNEGDSLDLVLRSRDKIESEAKYMASLGVPVFLRFGAEMNGWTKQPDPQKFIEAFRFVSDIVRRNAPNVAMVWSISSVGTIGVPYSTFYPGDRYVDWVGISLYTNKYHVGRSDQSPAGQAMFMTGMYSNPVNLIGRLVSEYGDRKPVMVSEGGVENRSNSLGRDETEFALEQMRLMYEFMPIVYPQLKLMIWFNNVPPAVERSNYALFNHPAAMARYVELTASDYFIKAGQEVSEVTYKKLGAETAAVPVSKVKLTTYAPFLMYDNVNVRYYLNDERLGSLSDYTQTFDLSSRANGTYTLKVEVRSGSTVLESLSYSLVKSASTVAIRSGSPATSTTPTTPATPVTPPTSGNNAALGNVLHTDVTATINGQVIPSFNISGNTMIIVEHLRSYGFDVAWDRNTRTLRVSSFDAGKPVTPEPVEAVDLPVGAVRFPYVATDIKTFVNGVEVEGFNIRGQTIINFNNLRAYGDVSWNSAARTISLVTK